MSTGDGFLVKGGSSCPLPPLRAGTLSALNPCRSCARCLSLCEFVCASPVMPRRHCVLAVRHHLWLLKLALPSSSTNLLSYEGRYFLFSLTGKESSGWLALRYSSGWYQHLLSRRKQRHEQGLMGGHLDMQPLNWVRNWGSAS